MEISYLLIINENMQFLEKVDVSRVAQLFGQWSIDTVGVVAKEGGVEPTRIDRAAGFNWSECNIDVFQYIDWG